MSERPAGEVRARVERAALAVLGDGDGATLDVAHVGRGGGRDVYRVRAASGGGASGASIGAAVAELAVLVPHTTDDGSATRLDREVRLLRALEEASLPFRVARGARIVHDEEGSVLVEEFLSGAPASLEDGRLGEAPACLALGRMLAALHRVDARAVPKVAWDFAPAREHARVALADVEREVDALAPDGEALAARALTWLRASATLATERASVLLHGDLLGRNVLVAPNLPPAVLDWEYAHLGDAAYDVAITGGGWPAPFGPGSSIEDLLEAYRAGAGGDDGDDGDGGAGRDVSIEDVHFYAVALSLRTFARAVRGDERWGTRAALEPALAALLDEAGA